MPLVATSSTTVLRSATAAGATMIVASHELDRAGALATRVVEVVGGQIRGQIERVRREHSRRCPVGRDEGPAHRAAQPHPDQSGPAVRRDRDGAVRLRPRQGRHPVARRPRAGLAGDAVQHADRRAALVRRRRLPTARSTRFARRACPRRASTSARPSRSPLQLLVLEALLFCAVVRPLRQPHPRPAAWPC